MSADSPIERYLDELVIAMTARQPRRLRHLVAEAEAHLRDDAAAGEGRGLSRQDAEIEAVTRFGAAQEVSAAERRRDGGLIRQIIGSVILLGSVGAVAVGLSGIVAAIWRAIGGSQAVAGAALPQVLSPGRCAQWLALDPGAHSCREAAINNWADETVFYRIAVGILGAIALIAFRSIRRRAPRLRVSMLPRVVTDTVGAVLFAAAAAWTLSLGLDTLIQGQRGAGQWLSAAPVALLAGIGFGLRLVADLGRPDRVAQ